MMNNSDLEHRVRLYSQIKNRSILTPQLGGGTDGTVWETDQKTAVKIFHKREVYANELECYKRFLNRNIVSIHGFSVPRLVDYDSNLLAVEMNVVEPPRILDFGKVILDRTPDFSQQTMAYWYESQKELWGAHWPTIRKILSTLKGMGIHYSDPNPYNITPENWDPDL